MKNGKHTLFQKFDTLSTRLDSQGHYASRYGWILDVEDESLSQRLRELPPEDLELLTLLVIDGYRQADIARMKGCSRSAVSQRMKKIIIFLKNA